MLREASRFHPAPVSLDERPRVLLVDDDPDVAHTVSNILHQEQCEVAITRAPTKRYRR
ncbi:MAG TPA: response regulator [Gemmataceae bacterium]|nr:response regulator [Gemmataceae bacterium]